MTGTIREYIRVLQLVWPLALGMANNAVMQFVDRAFLARVSEWAIEAVLPASVLSFLFIGVFQSLAAYCGVFVAQYHGARDERGCARAYAGGLAMTVLSAMALIAIIPVGGLIFGWCGHAPEVVAHEVQYFDIVTAGGFALCGTMAASGYFTGRGHTRVVFAVNLLGNVANIALDWALIFGLGPIPAMGIRGAAYGTVAAQVMQMVALNGLAMRDVSRRFAADGGVRLFASSEDVRAFRRLFVRMLRFGAPASVYQFFNFLSFTIFVLLTGRIGGMAFAASNAAFTVNYLLVAPVEGFSIGASTLVGQGQGAGNPRLAAAGARRTLVLALGYVTAVSVLVLLFHRPVLALFATEGASYSAAEFTSLGFTLFLLMTAWQLFDAADVTLSGALKGAGDTTFVMVWMLFSSFVFWMPLLFWAYRRWHSMVAIWSTMIAYVVVICIGTSIRWFRGSWRKIKLV